MIPPNLTDLHIQQAVKDIDINGIPLERKSVHYDLVINHKKYPPKLVISLATKFAQGIELPSSDFNAVEAKNYFKRRNYNVVDRREQASKEIVAEDDESEYPEGREFYQIHRLLERDKKMPKKAKAKRLAETGRLECDVCGLDFGTVYGNLGHGFIEAHHKIPVSQLDGTNKTRVSDFALVCSNCHRMLHRARPVLTVEELKKRIMNHG